MTAVSPFRDRFDPGGYRVFRRVVPRELVERAVDAVCDFLNVAVDDPATWYRAPGENGGVVPLHHAQAFWDNRQHPAVYDAFREVYGHGRLWVTMDRAAFRPPFREGMESPQADGWHRSLGNIHCDADPRKPHPGHVQGVLLLTDTPRDAGGFQCVPEGDEVVQITGEAGDLIVWDPFLPHGPANNFSRSPRIAQYISMVPESSETERQNRIRLFEERRAPEWWRGLVGQLDPEPGPSATLTPLGRRLVGFSDLGEAK